MTAFEIRRWPRPTVLAGLAVALCASFGGASPAMARIVEYGPPIVRAGVVVGPGLVVPRPVIVAPPAVPVAVVPAPRPGWIWAPGYWRWAGDGYAWVAGAWMRARPGYVYLPARWEVAPRGWTFLPGGWVVQ